MGSKLNFVFSTCPPHFCCMFTILADVRKNRLLYVGKCWKCCKNPPCFPTHILWIKIFLTMDFDFLRYRGLQGTHMDAWKPSGIFWTKFVDLEQGVACTILVTQFSFSGSKLLESTLFLLHLCPFNPSISSILIYCKCSLNILRTLAE